MRTLGEIADKTAGVELRRADVTLLAVAQGFGHAAANAIVFCWSWLPLALGRGVLYTDRCRRNADNATHIRSLVANGVTERLVRTLKCASRLTAARRHPSCLLCR